MTRVFLIAVACITMVAFVGACGVDAKREDPVRQDMPEKFQKVEPEKAPVQKKKAAPKAIKGRKRYEAFASARIRDAENSLQTMQSRAMKASGRSRKKAEQNVRTFQEYIHGAHVNISNLERADVAHWERAKRKMERSLLQLARFTD